MIDYLVFDTETTIYKYKNRFASSFCKDNYIVALGFKVTGSNVDIVYDKDGNKDVAENLFQFLPNVKTLVGFNIKFDLLYIWHDPRLQEWIKAGGQIWDVQLAEYMISGQEHIMPSLDNVSRKYNGTVKDERLDMLWKAGVNTPDIDKDILLPYLEQDVLNTELCYLKQLEYLKNNQQLKKLIEIEMDFLLATTEMEYNGLYVDDTILNTFKQRFEQNIMNTELMLRELLGRFYDHDPILLDNFNFNSNDHLAALFFGNEIKVKTKELKGRYKTGNRAGEEKYGWITHIIHFNGFRFKNEKAKKTPSGKYQVDDKQIISWHNKYYQEECFESLFITELLNYKKINKLYNTYIEGIEKLRDHNVVHHTLNHTITTTGRLSSSNPNSQNIPREVEDTDLNVKKMFTSRYENGVIIECDYKSLEVVAAAYLSQDEQMLKDIKEGVDVHLNNAALIYNTSIDKVTKYQRQAAKIASFQLLYGAGIKTITNTQFDGNIELAENFINAYYDRYPTLKLWQKKNIELVEQSRQISDKYTKLGFPAGKGTYKSHTGREYIFYEYDAPAFLLQKGIMTSFSPSEIKNYPVQGFATADLVPLMVGTLFRHLINHRDKCVLINTVHDSVILDCRPEYKDQIVRGCKKVLENTKEVCYNKLNIDVNVPVEVEIKSGPSWGELR